MFDGKVRNMSRVTWDVQGRYRALIAKMYLMLTVD